MQYTNFIADPADYMKIVQKDWKRFIDSGSTDGLDVRDEILASWKRSIECGASGRPGSVISEENMKYLLIKNSLLTAAAMPILKDFAELLRTGGKDSIINLCDPDAVILKLLTSGSKAEKDAEVQKLLPGAILNETNTGTTGVAMVKNTNMPYALYGAEHYPDIAKTWCCAAAPIRNLHTKDIIGILAISADDMHITTDTMGMVTFVARTIESNLFMKHSDLARLLSERYRQILPSSSADLIVTLDTYRNIHASSVQRHALIEQGHRLKGEIDLIAEEAINSFVRGQGDKAVFEYDGPEYHLEFTPVYCKKLLGGVVLEASDKSQGSQVGVLDISSETNGMPTLVGSDPLFLNALKTAKKVARTDASVLLLGETGVGKEGFARTIYALSKRSNKPLVTVNCGAIPKELIGSELFGYAPGAFTGASPKGSKGKIEAAAGGTLFLDEVGELPLDAQTYLLRILEEKEFSRIGSNTLINVDVRIISSTNIDLQDAIEKKLFRSDLYYRLNMIELRIPPLRNRLSDLKDLIRHFDSLDTRQIPDITDDEIRTLQEYSWPGNVRELKNVIKSAHILGIDTMTILTDYVQKHIHGDNEPVASEPDIPNGGFVDSLKYTPRTSDIMRALDACGGNVSMAARRLGVARSTIYRRLKK
jgi:transcriptional regulator of acetoin/glycerol metabolism